MIKPEDIQESVIEDVEARLGNGCASWDISDPCEVVAEVLNVAIEAGLVSPSCWAIIVDKDSDLYRMHAGYISDGEQVNPLMIAETKAVAEHMRSEHFLGSESARVEHWKGQTE